jgi:uncharacterized protein (DUF608 family)
MFARTGQAEAPPAIDLTAWTQSLRGSGERRIYQGTDRAQIQFPLGGIGAGQVFLSGHGRLGVWQNVNNFNSNALCDAHHFGLWVRQGDRTVAVLLEAEPPEGLPGAPGLTFAGEYPMAWIDYGDAGTGLPIRVRLEAYSPMIPLNAKDSGLPAAVFGFSLENLGDARLDAALLMTVPNLTGWDGYHALQGVASPGCFNNQNRVEGDRLLLGAAPGETDSLERAVTLVTNSARIAQALRLTRNVDAVEGVKAPADAVAENLLYWFGAFSGETGDADLVTALDHVAAGASLVVSGASGGLLGLLARQGAPVASHLFDDFEDAFYGPWTASGDAFGPGPVGDPLPGQSPVSGFTGAKLANSFFRGDDATGTLTSNPFTIAHDFIHLRVGGGDRGQDTSVRLVVDGAVVHSVTGNNTEVLRPVQWDVSALRGKQAHIELVDQAKGGWGHILADDIQFSDGPVAPQLSESVLARLREALPIRWRDAQPSAAPARFRRRARLGSLKAADFKVERFHQLSHVTLHGDAKVLLKTREGHPLVVAGTHGKGRIVVVNGVPELWAEGLARKTLLGTLAGIAVGADYQPQTGWGPESPHYGGMAVQALGGTVSACPQWDDFNAVWQAFAATGQLAPGADGPSAYGKTWHGALCVSTWVVAGATSNAGFLLGWHFPNRMRDDRYGWGPGKNRFDHRLGNQYNNWFEDAGAVLDYVQAELPRLRSETTRYHAALYNSTLPRWYVDAISANTAIVRSPIYVWLEDGSVGGFEGTDACCPMNCTHVYNYAMVMPYLYPALERRVRAMDLLAQMDPEQHFIPHRTVFPMSLPRLGNEIGGPYHHALDGELGTLLKLYREWRQCGDRTFLNAMWPNACMVMRHVMRDHDIDGSGVLRGEQPNTYDTHLFGSNTFIGSLYLATLRAMETLAGAVGDREFADECAARYRAGRRGYDKACWNGSFYVNNFDAPGVDPSVYNQGNCYGLGCHADQLLGQWWAHLLDLGHVLPEDHVRKAMAALYAHNWRASLANHQHVQRVFAEGEEMGLLTCTWPNGGRPENPMLYCDEVWTGLEYHAAATLLYEGLEEEALRVVRGARDRYTGGQRNPWSEIECGGFYARAMAAWGLLHAASGFAWDADSGALAILPRLWRDDGFKGFLITGTGWGSADVRRGTQGGAYQVTVHYGNLFLRSLTLPMPHAKAKSATSATVTVEDDAAYSVESKRDTFTVYWPEGITITPAAPLRLRHSG